MAKKTHKKSAKIQLSPRVRFTVLPLLAVVATAAVILTVVSIIVIPYANQGAQRGVGADGFQAFEEKNTNLGIAKVVSKDEVGSALGNKAKTVGDVSVSNVFNIDGNRGQTATYPFTRADGKKVSLYVDLMFFKNPASLDAAHIYTNTAKTDDLAGYPAYYMHAQTLGSDREYRLMVVNGLKVYKFVMVQPYRDITISEVGALATLKKLAAHASL